VSKRILYNQSAAHRIAEELASDATAAPSGILAEVFAALLWVFLVRGSHEPTTPIVRVASCDVFQHRVGAEVLEQASPGMPINDAGPRLHVRTTLDVAVEKYSERDLVGRLPLWQ
jgi:hypothetical protein